MHTPEHSILFVDDDANVRSSFSFAYGEDFPIIACRSASDALEALAEAEDIAVVLADERMPNLPGSKFLAEVRRRHPDVVRMLISAYSDLDAVIAAVNEGQISRYIHKPWRHDELLRLLRDGIETFRRRRGSPAKLGRLLDVIGANVRRLRLSKGVSQAAFAKQARLGVRTVEKVEQGQMNASLETLLALAEGLGVKLEELLVDLGPLRLERVKRKTT